MRHSEKYRYIRLLEDKMKQILVADHDKEIYQMTLKALQDYYAISPLPKNEQLIDYLKNKQADLILLTISDTDMKDCRAYDIIKRIPGMSDRPVIFLSRQGYPELEQRIIAIGASDYITLPISPELLRNRIKNYLELYELRMVRNYMEKYQDAISFSFAELVECRDVTTGGHLKNTTRYFHLLLNAAMESDLYKDRILKEDISDYFVRRRFMISEKSVLQTRFCIRNQR